MKKIWIVLFLSAVIVQITGCLAQSEESEEVIVYPNPYNPTKSFLNIKDAAGNSLGPNVKLIVYDFNLTEIYSGTLLADQYSGINSSGEPLPPGIYFLKIIVIDGTAEKVVRERYRLVVQ